jgi:hypothetical protein
VLGGDWLVMMGVSGGGGSKNLNKAIATANLLLTELQTARVMRLHHLVTNPNKKATLVQICLYDEINLNYINLD